MTKVEQQNAFIKDFARLILMADSFGLTVTAGELMRSQEQQNIYLESGRTTIAHSIHQDRMAGDLNFFKDGVLTYAKADIQKLGDYWESLNEHNKWGGNWTTFVDTPHFERHFVPE